jgi:hypothetical protein
MGELPTWFRLLYDEVPEPSGVGKTTASLENNIMSATIYTSTFKDG